MRPEDLRGEISMNAGNKIITHFLKNPTNRLPPPSFFSVSSAFPFVCLGMVVAIAAGVCLGLRSGALLLLLAIATEASRALGPLSVSAPPPPPAAAAADLALLLGDGRGGLRLLKESFA